MSLILKKARQPAQVQVLHTTKNTHWECSPVTGLSLELLGVQRQSSSCVFSSPGAGEGCAGGLPLLGSVLGVPDFQSAQCSWLSATAHSPAKSLSQGCFYQWDSLCKTWRHGVKILFPSEVSKASASAVYPLE